MTKTTACLLLTLLSQGWSFTPALSHHHVKMARYSTMDPQIFSPTASDLMQLKSDLVKLCNRSPKVSKKEAQMMVQELEVMGEQVCPWYIVAVYKCINEMCSFSSPWFASHSSGLGNAPQSTAFFPESGECLIVCEIFHRHSLAIPHLVQLTQLLGSSYIPLMILLGALLFFGPFERLSQSRPTKYLALPIIYRHLLRKSDQRFRILISMRVHSQADSCPK